MDRKGVTPVVGTSILVFMALAAAFTAYNFIEGTMGDIQSNAEDQLSEQELNSGSSIGVDTAYKNGDNDIEMVVRNTGEYYVNFTNWEFYNDGQPISSIDTTLPNGFDPQETQTVDTGVAFPTGSDTKVIEIQGEYVETSIACTPGNRC